MPPTDSADHPVRPATPAPPACGPAAATRSDAPLHLERVAAELESIADRWAVARTTSAAELERARTVLDEARTALHLLAESR